MALCTSWKLQRSTLGSFRESRSQRPVRARPPLSPIATVMRRSSFEHELGKVFFLGGALLIAVAPEGADSVQRAVEAIGVPVVGIGEVRPSSEGITIVTNGNVEPLTSAVRDEIARALEGG
jgi:hypothetical protein